MNLHTAIFSQLTGGNDLLAKIDIIKFNSTHVPFLFGNIFVVKNERRVYSDKFKFFILHLNFSNCMRTFSEEYGPFGAGIDARRRDSFHLYLLFGFFVSFQQRFLEFGNSSLFMQAEDMRSVSLYNYTRLFYSFLQSRDFLKHGLEIRSNFSWLFFLVF